MAEYTGRTWGLKKKIGKNVVYLSKSWDLVHGKGWFCHIWVEGRYLNGFGHHKTNRFTAYRKAIKNIMPTLQYLK